MSGRASCSPSYRDLGDAIGSRLHPLHDLMPSRVGRPASRARILRRPGQAAFVLVLLFASLVFPPQTVAAPSGTRDLGTHIVIGWNDLGMHCANRSFADLCVLPPYNTIWSVVIVRGDATTLPQVHVAGYEVTYSLPDNTYSAGKTDFPGPGRTSSSASTCRMTSA